MTPRTQEKVQDIIWLNALRIGFGKSIGFGVCAKMVSSKLTLEQKDSGMGFLDVHSITIHRSVPGDPSC